ncbi:MAG: MoaD/ThiS family protein [Desulfobacterales bacterium]|nr:MoaD/ThiS family protein [Desulfobacterales bacterium]MDJ0883003.1 MoaD/ThiS family protein [Desulfobacterales bacterium]MDJ0886513.1 MoaD/ThiS family protein [Desulfobacterales bacterium]
MKIQLKLFANLRAYTPDDAEAYPITPGMTVREIVDHLKIPLEDAKLIFINSKRRGLETPLTDGDRVGIFPPVGGG